MSIELYEFLSNLLAIIVIDLVLAGDNAIVIALATQHLPKTQQKKAILWGTLGAITLRAGMTFVALWLLKIPGLLGIGGCALLWIAYRLLLDSNSHQDDEKIIHTTFAGAMKTIIIADAVMGVDNVLAVAGAAEGSFTLVILGLLISIPIVIFASQLVLSLLKKFPWLIYIGASVLILTGIEMIREEPLISQWFTSHPWRVVGFNALAFYLVFKTSYLAKTKQNRKALNDT